MLQIRAAHYIFRTSRVIDRRLRRRVWQLLHHILKPKQFGFLRLSKVHYHRFRWYATLQNKTPAETLPKFPSVLRVIDRSDRNPPITATSVTFWPSLRHASRLWLVDFDPICRYHVRLTEILETSPRVFCFPKSRINEKGGNKVRIYPRQLYRINSCKCLSHPPNHV